MTFIYIYIIGFVLVTLAVSVGLALDDDESAIEPWRVLAKIALWPFIVAFAVIFAIVLKLEERRRG